MAPSSILVVDDEGGIRSSLQAILREEGWQADAVASGEVCVKAAAKKSYDLILLDVRLPGGGRGAGAHQKQLRPPPPRAVGPGGGGGGGARGAPGAPPPPPPPPPPRAARRRAG